MLDFMRKYCCSLGNAAESLLAVCLHAGVRALPSLVKLSGVLAAGANKPPPHAHPPQSAWDALEQLPVEIELGRDFVFRSIFACPVAREQSTPENPPMILPCGLVLCRASIQKLARGNARTFKCPYCPVRAPPGARGLHRKHPAHPPAQPQPLFSPVPACVHVRARESGVEGLWRPQVAFDCFLPCQPRGASDAPSVSPLPIACLDTD